MKRLVIVLLSSFGAIGTAHAQAQTQFGPDNGFFRPAPDVALAAPRSNGRPTFPQPQPFLTLQSPGMPPASVPVPAFVVPVPAAPSPATAPVATQQPVQQPALPGPQPTQDAQAWAERQMDRSVSEAERERARAQAAPAGVGAAFDGSTSSENR